MATRRKQPRKHARPSKPAARWSRQVMLTSDALDLEPGVFTFRSPRQIALSLKRSAEASTRRKTSPYASAMSMLNFHINRSGAQLTAERRKTLAKAKEELRVVFGRTPEPAPPARASRARPAPRQPARH